MPNFSKKLGVEEVHQGAHSGGARIACRGERLTSFFPIDGGAIASIIQATKEEYDKIVNLAQNPFLMWRMTPAPVRGRVVRETGLELRKYKEPLGRLVSLEMGKIVDEAVAMHNDVDQGLRFEMNG